MGNKYIIDLTKNLNPVIQERMCKQKLRHKTIQWRKESLFNKWCWILGPYLIMYTKINSVDHKSKYKM